MKSTILLATVITALVLPGQAATTISVSGSGATGDATLILTNATSFTVTSNYFGGIIFAIDGCIPVPTSYSTTLVSSTVTYSINGGSSFAITGWDEGYSAGSGVTADDSFFYRSNNVSLNIGDVITLSAGSITMTGPANSNFTVPAAGTYEMFITNSNADGKISANGVAVPEPSSSILACLASVGLIVRRRRQ